MRIDLQRPYSKIGAKPRFFGENHFDVLHADAGILIVAVNAKGLQTIVVAVHAPTQADTRIAAEW